MLMGEVDIGIIQDPLPTIIQVGLVDCWVYLFMITREVDIGLIPAILLYITIVDYKLSTQGSLKKLPDSVNHSIIARTMEEHRLR